MQLWCAAGVNIDNCQQADNVISSSANSVESSEHSHDSISSVCERVAEKCA